LECDISLKADFPFETHPNADQVKAALAFIDEARRDPRNPISVCPHSPRIL
jgi:hypothetical protein